MFNFVEIAVFKPSFDLSDLGSLISAHVAVKKEKKEKEVVAAAKPRVPLLRSKTPKKRKADSADLEIFEGMSSIDAIRKLQALANLVKIYLGLVFRIPSKLSN